MLVGAGTQPGPGGAARYPPVLCAAAVGGGALGNTQSSTGL